MRLKAGSLREKIIFKRPVRASNGSGGYDTSYNEILSTYASVEEISSDPSLIASQENISQVVKIYIRYRPIINVKNGDVVFWRDFEFVVNNIKVDIFRTYIEFTLTTIIDNSNRSGLIPTAELFFDETFDLTFN